MGSDIIRPRVVQGSVRSTNSGLNKVHVQRVSGISLRGQPIATTAQRQSATSLAPVREKKQGFFGKLFGFGKKVVGGLFNVAKRVVTQTVLPKVSGLFSKLNVGGLVGKLQPLFAKLPFSNAINFGGIFARLFGTGAAQPTLPPQ